ncbi:hypothetical protein BpHYR1_004242, partial [Brachionus plicatilis]
MANEQIFPFRKIFLKTCFYKSFVTKKLQIKDPSFSLVKMRLENEVQCQKLNCKSLSNGEVLENENGKCVAKCLECDISMCTPCLLEHHHKLISLVSPVKTSKLSEKDEDFLHEEINTKMSTEIEKTFNFYIQTLQERKEYLVKELNTIIQFALLNHNQNINKQLQVQFQLEMKKQQIEKEITDEYDLMNGHQSSTDSTESALKNKLNFLNELNNLIL